jgi:O-antigen/teichoic acid export membrane protein
MALETGREPSDDAVRSACELGWDDPDEECPLYNAVPTVGPMTTSDPTSADGSEFDDFEDFVATNLEGVPLAVPHSKRRVYTSLASGFTSVVAISVLGAIAVRAITTGQGASAYGTFVLVMSVMTLTQNLSSLGMAQVLTREVASGKMEESRLLSLAMGLRVTLGVLSVPIAYAIGVALYGHHADDIRIALGIILLAIPLMAATQVCYAHFSAQVRNVVTASVSLAQQTVYCGLVLVAVFLQKSVVYSVAAVVVGWAVAAVIVLTLTRREVKVSVAFDRSEWMTMLRVSAPIGLAYILGTLYMKADTLILGAMSTTRQVGYYGVAYAVMSFFLVLPSVLTQTFMAGLTKASDVDLGPLMRNALTYFATLGVLATTGIVVCGSTIVRIFAGPHFQASVTPLRILGFGLIFLFTTSGLSGIAVARGSANRLFMLSSVALALNVLLNIAVIPRFGIRGSAAATVVCEALSSVLIAWLIRTELNLRPQTPRLLIRPLVAGVVTCAVLFPFYSRSDLGILGGIALIPAVGLIFAVVLLVVRGYPEDLASSVRASLFGQHGRFLGRSRKG